MLTPIVLPVAVAFAPGADQVVVACSHLRAVLVAGGRVRTRLKHAQHCEALAHAVASCGRGGRA